MPGENEAKVHGHCDPAFRAVREALEQNLADPDEIGEAVSVVVDGKTVVDLWGGYRDVARSKPWNHETIVCVFSAAKPIGALAVLMLIERGQIELDAPVTRYWPEFGQAGKDHVTVRQLLGHFAGIPGAFAAVPGDAYDWQRMIQALEIQAPLWPPGTQGCYHTFSYGYLCGELVRRVTGKSLGKFVQDEIAGPLKVDLHIGLSPEQQKRCAEVFETPNSPFGMALRDPTVLLGKCWIPLPIADGTENWNTPLYRSSEMPSGNAHGSARALATIYGALARGGELGGVHLLEQPTVATMLTEQWSTTDPLGLTSRMALGFMLHHPALAAYNDNPHSFGHIGLGGVFGFGDPDAKLGFGFVTNRMAPVTDLGPYGGRLAAAAMASL